jgi:predicted NBD/HSP70 family sugar kinase
MYELVLEASKLLFSKNDGNIPLKVIVITLPGRVNSKTGDLTLSIQFDEELFTEEHAIQHIFDHQFPGIPIILANDNNVMSLGELHNGGLKKCGNGLYFNIDYGIGGGIIINNSFFGGDLGYAGEFGLIKYYDGKEFSAIDEFVSLRALEDKAGSILGHKVDRDELFAQYRKNAKIKEMVLESAAIVGRSLVQITEMLDISKVIISGRVENFGEEYLKILKKNCVSSVRELNVSYSKLGNKAVLYGTSSIGVRYIFDLVKSRK